MAILIIAGYVGVLSCGAVEGPEEVTLLPGQVAVLRALAQGEPADWPGMTDAQAEALAGKADAQFRNHQQYHLPHGLSVDVFWRDYERTAVGRYDTVGDSAAWAGHYLAALALRYAAHNNPADLDAIREVLDKFAVLTKVTGIEGYIARYAGPADDPGYREYYNVYGRGEDPGRPGLGKKAYRGAAPYENLVWLGDSSRDAYDGFNFGIATVWAHVDDPEVRAKIRDIVSAVAANLKANEFHIVDDKGHRTRPTPWFQLAWLRTIASVCPGTYPDLVAQYRELAPRAIEAGHRVSGITYREYFANNLRFIRMYVLCVLEDEPETKKGLQQVLRGMYEEVADHLNAQFAAIYLAGTGDRNEQAIATLQGQLIAIPGPPRWARQVDYREGGPFELREDTNYVEHALLANEMVPSDFLWQRSPVLSHGSADAPYEFPGLDLILPYWMGRFAGVIPEPN